MFAKRAINFFFKKNLLITNCFTSGAFMAIGDAIHQEFEYRTGVASEFDWDRAGRMFTVGALLGPFHHYYYIQLDKFLPTVNVRNVFKKIAADQLFCGPVTIVVFFYALGFLEKKTLDQSTEEVKNKFKFVYLGDCLFWPPIQFINFYYLRTEYRVFYINFATMIFDIFLSFSKHFDKPHNSLEKNTEHK